MVAVSPVGGRTSRAQDQAPPPVFRAAVDRVAVATMVRDRQGRPITDLRREDFQLFDAGLPRTITEFRSDATPVSVALLMDVSGSMGFSGRREAVRAAAEQVLNWLTPADQVGLWAFDKRLTELAPFGSTGPEVLKAIQSVRPFGMTSLFDAIAETGRMLAATGGTHRAIIALTDGADNASQLTSAQVSAIAGEVDVPVYLLMISSPLDRPRQTTPDDTGLDAALQGRLVDLARVTGGEVFVASSPARNSTAARQIVTELRHQYLIVFEPDLRPGWHAIDIRTRQKDLVVRARSGYVVQGRPVQR
jgi:VWFA-related protein